MSLNPIHSFQAERLHFNTSNTGPTILQPDFGTEVFRNMYTNSDLAFQACRAPLLVHQSNFIVEVTVTACLQVIWRGDNFRTEGARHASGVRRDRILQDPSAHHEDDQAASRKLTQEPTSS